MNESIHLDLATTKNNILSFVAILMICISSILIVDSTFTVIEYLMCSIIINHHQLSWMVHNIAIIKLCARLCVASYASFHNNYNSIQECMYVQAHVKDMC